MENRSALIKQKARMDGCARAFQSRKFVNHNNNAPRHIHTALLVASSDREYYSRYFRKEG